MEDKEKGVYVIARDKDGKIVDNLKWKTHAGEYAIAKHDDKPVRVADRSITKCLTVVGCPVRMDVASPAPRPPALMKV